MSLAHETAWIIVIESSNCTMQSTGIARMLCARMPVGTSSYLPKHGPAKLCHRYIGCSGCVVLPLLSSSVDCSKAWCEHADDGRVCEHDHTVFLQEEVILVRIASPARPPILPPHEAECARVAVASASEHRLPDLLNSRLQRRIFRRIPHSFASRCPIIMSECVSFSVASRDNGTSFVQYAHTMVNGAWSFDRSRSISAWKRARMSWNRFTVKHG